MISYEEFEKIVVDVLERDISSNKAQNAAIVAPKDQSQFIVAGPGSGKTTVMVLKILKFIFVDDIDPSEILATTFTKKAANELLSRILSWGDKIRMGIEVSLMDRVFEGEDISDLRKQILRVDLNQINVGTTDSIADELLRIHRDPGTSKPILIEEFVANSVMINECLLKNDTYRHETLQEYLAEITGLESPVEKNPKVNNINKMAEILIEIKDALYHYMVDINEILKDISPKEIGKQMAFKIIMDYVDRLKSQNIYDFSMLEREFLNRLNSGKLKNFLKDIKIVLVDEYQDTNLLQESIYFKIAEAAVKNGGSITVVGDDDQSLYRFRGASVDLFTNFIERVSAIGIDAKEINLKTNYRSSENIIDLCNDFVELDSKYQDARVKEKPKIVFPNLSENETPILGMFRNKEEKLAMDLANFLDELIRKGAVKRKVKRILTKDLNRNYTGDAIETRYNYINSSFKLAEDKEILIELDENGGSPEDISFLSYSTKERSRGNANFPLVLKERLEGLREPIKVFNPRGQDLQDILSVAVFCGLMLECIDPGGLIQRKNKRIPGLANRNMNIWRKKALSFIKEVNPEPHSPVSLEDFLTHWQLRQAFSTENPKDLHWPKEAGLMELAYKLVTWFEEFQNDDEGVVYLKAITQTINQTSFFNKYSGKIDFSSDENEKESINEALMNIFVPIAVGRVKLDENYFEVIPPNRLNFMSIHQSKGLEFPLVIVDVGSKFNKNTVKESSLRFPKKSDSSAIIQEKIRKYSPLADSTRDNTDMAFDDLTRLYFVAFSRAKDVLMLVGLNNSLDGYKYKEKVMKIPNVALGWNRDEEFIGFDDIYLI